MKANRAGFYLPCCEVCLAATMELLAGLEPATYCHPQKNAAFKTVLCVSLRFPPFFGGPVV